MNNLKSVLVFCFLQLIVSLLIFSCKKGPGEGGRSSIKGRVYSVNYNSGMTVPQDSGYLGAQKVYIIYGDETAVGEDQDTNPDGSYEFLYLRKGTYKVYTYSKTMPNHLDSAVIQTSEIAARKQTVELPDFKIRTNKN